MRGKARGNIEKFVEKFKKFLISGQLTSLAEIRQNVDDPSMTTPHAERSGNWIDLKSDSTQICYTNTVGEGLVAK